MEETARPGQPRVRVRTSKANQDGARADWRLLVSGFAAALRDRRECVRPADEDRVVPLSPGQVARRLAALGRVAGIEGLSGHSGRVGMATDLIRRGASTTSVQDAGGWRDPGMVARYAASVDVEDGAVARYFGNGA